MADKKWNTTPLRNFRLKEDTMADLERLRLHYGLRSLADVIRFVVKRAVRQDKPQEQEKASAAAANE